MEVKILIAPWGDPAGWQETTYKFGDKKVRSNSSLKILQESLQPDFTLVLSSDTLAVGGNTYKEVKESAKAKIEEYCKAFSISNIDTIVLPGIGIFKDRKTNKEVHFTGSSQDYYYSLIYNLKNKILKILNLHREVKNIDFHLDITHGVNYMPVLTYRAIKEISENLSLFYNVSLTVYNTDPAMPFSLVKEININRIENSKILPNPLKEKANNYKLFEYFGNIPHDKKSEIGKNINKLTKKISYTFIDLNAFLGSIVNGFPLSTFTFFPEIEELKLLVEESYTTFENYISIKNDVILNVERLLKLNNNFKVYNLLILISELFKTKNIINQPKKEVELKELIDLKEKFFIYDTKLHNFISNEIEYNLQKILQKAEIDGEKWVPLIEIIYDEKPKPLNKRNFIAHAGLEYSAVEVKKDKEKFYFRYRDENITQVKKFSQEGLTPC